MVILRDYVDFNPLAVDKDNQKYVVPAVFDAMLKTKVKKIDKVNNVPVISKENVQLDYLLQNTIIRSKRHLETCDCMQGKYEELYKKGYNNLVDELCASRSDTRMRVLSRMTDLRTIALDRLLEFVKLNNVVCKYEYKEVLRVLHIFSDKYDLSDARANVMVQVVIDNLLTMLRMEREINHEGIAEVYSDDKGVKRIIMNPFEEAKRRYNESLVNTITALDKIFEGSKITIDSSKVINLEDIFKDIEIVEGEYREIPNINTDKHS